MRVIDLFEIISGRVFHYTRVGTALKILQSGEFELSHTLGTSWEQQYAPKGYPYFLSTTRTRRGGYHDYIGQDAVLFELDGDFYNQRYPGRAVDYWNNRDPLKSHHRPHEAEDRIFSREPAIPAAVRVVDIYISPDADEAARARARRLMIVAKQRKTPVNLFNDKEAWLMRDTRHVADVSQLRGQDPARGYVTRRRGGYLKPWMELIQAKQKSQLSKDADSKRYNLQYTYDKQGMAKSLAVDLSNARKPGPDADRNNAVRVIQFMQQNRLGTVNDLVNFLADKWKTIKEGVVEAVIPSEQLKSSILYHGTPTKAGYDGIAREGLKVNPELIAQKYKGQEDFSPLPGVYMTKEFGNAVRYSFMSEVSDEQYADYIKQEPYGYVFEFSGKNLSTVTPDEDELGSFLEKLVKTKNLPPNLLGIVQSIPQQLRIKLQQSEIDFQTTAVAGKWVVNNISDATMQYLLKKYHNVVNYSSMKPIAVWVIPKPNQRFLRDRQGTFNTHNGYNNYAKRFGKRYILSKQNQGVAEGFSNDMSTEDMIGYLKQHHDKNLHPDYLDHLTRTNSKFVLKNIPINSIKTELSGLDRAKVERYKTMDFSKAPPIVVGSDGYILDGYHRATVAKALGIPTIKAYVGVQSRQGVAEDLRDDTIHSELTELFNTQPSKSATWARPIGQWEDMDQFNFVASNGIAYQVDFLAPWAGPDELAPYVFFEPDEEISDQAYESAKFVEFEQKSSEPGDEGKQGIEGTGAAAEVFGIVTNVILQYIKKAKPSMLYFQAAEPNRQRLYARMATRVAQTIGWKVKRDGSAHFAIYNPREIKDRLPNQGVAEDLRDITELRYLGNLGIMELVKFFREYPQYKEKYLKIKNQKGTEAANQFAFNIMKVELEPIT